MDEAFAEAAAGEGGTGATGIVGDGGGEARVAGGGEEGGLAHAGMADGDNASGIDCGDGLEEFENPGEAPCPCGDGAPAVGWRGGVVVFLKQAMNAIGKAIVEIGIEVAGIDGGDGVTPLEDCGERPAIGAAAAGSRASAISGNVEGLVILGPILVKADAGVGMDGMIAVEVKAEESGDGPVRVIGEGEEESNGETVIFIPEDQIELAERGEPLQGIGDIGLIGCFDRDGGGGRVAVEVVAEELEDFGTAAGPILRAADRFAGLESEQFRQ